MKRTGPLAGGPLARHSTWDAPAVALSPPTRWPLVPPSPKPRPQAALFHARLRLYLCLPNHHLHRLAASSLRRRGAFAGLLLAGPANFLRITSAHAGTTRPPRRETSLANDVSCLNTPRARAQAQAQVQSQKQLAKRNKLPDLAIHPRAKPSASGRSKPRRYPCNLHRRPSERCPRKFAAYHVKVLAPCVVR